MSGRILRQRLNSTLCVAIACLIASSAASAAQPPAMDWAVQLGTSVIEYGLAVAVDSANNAYIAGSTYGVLAAPGAGHEDAFLVKVDVSGAELWRKQFGTYEYEDAQFVAVDSAQNVYITGKTSGDFAGRNAGSSDVILVKFDASGNELWRRQVGTSGHDYGYSVTTDRSGNVLVAGETTGDLGGLHADHYDPFLLKFDSTGNELWRRQFGTQSNQMCRAMAVDAAGNAYLTYFTIPTLGYDDPALGEAFLLKVDAAGNQLWLKQFGTSSNDYVMSVAADASGNAYITGETGGSLGGPNAGSMDPFLIKVDTAGNELWRRQYGTSEWDSGYFVAVDTEGNAFITGNTRGDLGGPSAGESDTFIIKVDASGSELWRTQFGTSSTDSGYVIALDASGSAYISGATRGNLAAPNAGESDAYLVKFEADGLLATVDGDVNGDGFVDLNDFVILKVNFGSTSAIRSQGDLDGDGDVDLDDFIILKTNFGTSG